MQNYSQLQPWDFQPRKVWGWDSRNLSERATWPHKKLAHMTCQYGGSFKDVQINILYILKTLNTQLVSCPTIMRLRSFTVWCWLNNPFLAYSKQVRSNGKGIYSENFKNPIPLINDSECRYYSFQINESIIQNMSRDQLNAVKNKLANFKVWNSVDNWILEVLAHLKKNAIFKSQIADPRPPSGLYTILSSGCEYTYINWIE